MPDVARRGAEQLRAPLDEHSVFSKAHLRDRLWPSLHAAVDVYIKRRTAAAENYGLIWRLIHVWECCITTLAQAAIARVRSLPGEHSSQYLAAREKAYGVSRGEFVASADRVGQGALDGSVDKWIEILEYFAGSVSASSSTFLRALTMFLNAKVAETQSAGLELTPLAHAWSRICEAPSGLPLEKASPRIAMKVVNVFRNRFAHVPFPYVRLDEVHKQLEACTLRLFEIGPHACKDQWALSCSFGLRGSRLQGSKVMPLGEKHYSTKPLFLHSLDSSGETESWDAEPFIHIDGMQRAYILTRLKNSEGLWEYTRYLAESDAVLSVRSSDLLSTLPSPGREEYEAYEEEPEEDATIEGAQLEELPEDAQEEGPVAVSTPEPLETRDQAERALRNRDFQRGIDYFKKLVETRPEYHIGWLKLGYAQRELAVELRARSQADGAEAEQALRLLHECTSQPSRSHMQRNTQNRCIEPRRCTNPPRLTIASGYSKNGPRN